MSFLLLSAALAHTARAQDCNANGIDDALDIANGTSADCDGNGVPDECDIAEAEVLFVDFDGPLPPGVSLTLGGLWHVGPECRPPGACGGDDFAYFGVDATCDYETGAAEHGTLQLGGIALPAGDDVELSFCSYYEGEGGDAFDEYDLATVWIKPSGDPGLGSLLEFTSATTAQGTWETRALDLSTHAGLTVDLTFTFTTGDDFLNSFFGWGIDDLRVTASKDLNGNGVLDSCECSIASTCIGAPNSVGGGAAIGALGTSMIHRNDLVLTATGLPPNTFGIFYYGPTAALVPFGDGFRCVGPPFWRLPGVATGSGSVAFEFDLLDPLYNPGDQVAAGVTQHVQFWYRDTAAGGAGFNLSDALVVLFCP